MFNAIKGLFGSSSPPEPTQAMLQRDGEALYRNLSRQDQPELRDARLVEEGLRVLRECRGWGKVDWRQFALMHSASIVGQTHYEGGDIVESLKAWITILKLWKQDKGTFLVTQITDEQIEALIDTLETTLKFKTHTLLDAWFSRGSLSPQHLLKLAQDWQTSIESELRTKGFIYIPIGYRGGASSDGHVFIAKIVQGKGHVTIHLLNQGDGVLEHPSLGFTTTQERISYSFYPIKIENTLFFGKTGEALLCHLLRYGLDTPHPQHKPAEAKEIYDLFKEAGELIPDLGSHTENLEVNPQRVGDCSKKAPKNIVRDLLIHMDLPREELQLVFANVAFTSLMMGYHTHLKQPAELSRVFLHNAASEWGFLMQKLKWRLSKEEVALVTSVVTALLKETDRFKGRDRPLVVEEAAEEAASTSALKQMKERMTKPPKVVDVDNLPTKFSFPKGKEGLTRSAAAWKTEEFARAARMNTKRQVTPPYVPPTFSPSNCVDSFEEWNKRLDELPANLRAGFFYEAIFTLPIPTGRGEEDAVWGGISIAEGKRLLSLMKTFLLKGIGFMDCPLSPLISHLTVYSIADQIARQNPDTKLEHFASPFPFSFFRRQLFSIPLGRENVRFSQISQYFQLRAEEAEGRIIFPTHSKIPIEQALIDLKKEPQRGQVANHICYLQQFLRSSPQQPEGSLSEILALIHDVEGTLLPKEVRYLYFFAAFFNPIRLSSDLNTCSQVEFYYQQIPRFLRFEESIGGDKKIELTPSHSTHQIESFHFGRYQPLELAGVTESRFLLTNLFTERVQYYNTNDAVCVHYRNNSSIPEHIYRGLLRITRRDNLKVGQALEWMKSHFFYLGANEVRETLTHCFLAPGLLKQALEQEPSLINALREAIQEGLTYFGSFSIKQRESHYLIGLGVSIELIYRELFPDQSIDSFLQGYHEVLTDSQSELKLLIQLERGDLDPSDSEALFHQVMHRPFLLGTWLNKHHALFEDPVFVRELCGRCLPNDTACKIVEELHENNIFWEGSLPKFTIGSYSFNIFTKDFHHEGKGRIISNGWCETRAGWQIHKECALDDLLRRSGLDQEARWEKEKERLSADGTLRLYATPYGLRGERKVRINGIERWMEVHSQDNQIVEPVLIRALEELGEITEV